MSQITKIFVGSLPPNTRPEELRHLFQTYGAVLECDVVNRCGFVHMENQEMANIAIAALNGSDFKGQQINVEVGRPKDKSRQSFGAGGGAGPMRGRDGQQRGGRGGGQFTGGRGQFTGGRGNGGFSGGQPRQFQDGRSSFGGEGGGGFGGHRGYNNRDGNREQRGGGSGGYNGPRGDRGHGFGGPPARNFSNNNAQGGDNLDGSKGFIRNNNAAPIRNDNFKGQRSVPYNRDQNNIAAPVQPSATPRFGVNQTGQSGGQFNRNNNGDNNRNPFSQPNKSFNNGFTANGGNDQRDRRGFTLPSGNQNKSNPTHGFGGGHRGGNSTSNFGNNRGGHPNARGRGGFGGVAANAVAGAVPTAPIQNNYQTDFPPIAARGGGSAGRGGFAGGRGRGRPGNAPQQNMMFNRHQ